MTYTSSNPTSQRDFSYNLDGTLASITGSGSALVYTWNTNGQATSRTLNGVSTDLHWDVDGRLVSASQPAPDGGVSLDAQYVYDGLGMRRSASVNGVTRSWSWGGVDGEDEVGEDGKLTTSVGPYRVGEGTTAFTHDALGSVTGQNGMAIDYSVWGAQSAALTPESSAGFAGGRVESTLGLNYNRRRWEDPASGIFLSRDEVGAGNYLSSPNGIGPWSYAALSPARFADPDGRTETDRLRILLEFERPAAERMKNMSRNHGQESIEYQSALRDWMAAQRMYDEERISEEKGFLGLKLTAGTGAAVIAYPIIGGLALLSYIEAGVGFGVGASTLHQGAEVLDGTRNSIDPLEVVESGGWGGLTGAALGPLAKLPGPAQGLLAMGGFGLGVNQALKEFREYKFFTGLSTLVMSAIGAVLTTRQMADTVSSATSLLPSRAKPVQLQTEPVSTPNCRWRAADARSALQIHRTDNTTHRW